MKSKLGPKDPTNPPIDPNFKNANRVLSVGLRKDWAEYSSYWVEIYVKEFGKRNKHYGYFVYKQWAFEKYGDQVIQGGKIVNPSGTPLSRTSAAVLAAEQLFDRIKKKDDFIKDVPDLNDWGGLWEEVESHLASMLRTKVVADTNNKSLSEKFKESQLEREKKANW